MFGCKCTRERTRFVWGGGYGWVHSPVRSFPQNNLTLPGPSSPKRPLDCMTDNLDRLQPSKNSPQTSQNRNTHSDQRARAHTRDPHHRHLCAHTRRTRRRRARARARVAARSRGGTRMRGGSGDTSTSTRAARRTRARGRRGTGGSRPARSRNSTRRSVYIRRSISRAGGRQGGLDGGQGVNGYTFGWLLVCRYNAVGRVYAYGVLIV